MTLTQGRQAEALIKIINSYDIETQEELIEIYNQEMKDVFDLVVIKVVQNELGI